MPRRRLHGETQKRRKKPSTRLLKRADSPERVQATLQPAAFERTPQVEREDLEFLEAMREMEVQRGPWHGESAERRRVVEGVQFLAEEGEMALFQRSMAHLGVTPLQGDTAEAPPPSVPPAPAAATPQASAAPMPPTATEPAPASMAKPAPEPAAELSPAAASPIPVPPAQPGAPQTPPAPAPDLTEFELEPEARDLMASLLREEGFVPELKFAGATAPTRRRPARPAWEAPEAEPDSELDLHGKTQEEAIRMVQSFLLISQREHLRHVLIITGRGHNSGDRGPVLKDAVFRWLELNGKRFARAFARAPGRLGGEGAIWVTLR